MRKALFLDREHQVVTSHVHKIFYGTLQCNDELQ